MVIIRCFLQYFPSFSLDNFRGKLLILNIQTFPPQNDPVIKVTFKGKQLKQSNSLCKNEDILSALTSVMYKLCFCLNSTYVGPIHMRYCGTISLFLLFPAVEERVSSLDWKCRGLW